MHIKSFDHHWEREAKRVDAASLSDQEIRRMAERAWNAAISAAKGTLTLKSDEIRLCAGEMTAGEMRTCKAVLAGRAGVVDRLQVKD